MRGAGNHLVVAGAAICALVVFATQPGGPIDSLDAAARNRAQEQQAASAASTLTASPAATNGNDSWYSSGEPEVAAVVAPVPGATPNQALGHVIPNVEPVGPDFRHSFTRH
jgi:hypothetical protein